MKTSLCYYFVSRCNQGASMRSRRAKQGRREFLWGYVINWLLPSVTNYLTSQNSPLRRHVNDVLAAFIQRERTGEEFPHGLHLLVAAVLPPGAIAPLPFWGASVYVPSRVLRCSMLQYQQDSPRVGDKNCAAGAGSKALSGCAMWGQVESQRPGSFRGRGDKGQVRPRGSQAVCERV